jgi:pimeloyl-ACP methyl ester carboxylesterase
MALASRNELRFAAPELIGNLDGVPYSVRNLANRTVLTTTMHSLQNTIDTELGRTAVEKAELRLSMLQSISNALEDSSDTTTRTLLSLDTTGQGRAAIVVGDLITADYVSYMVPGMFFTIEGQMVYWTDAAARLRDEQQTWLARYGDTRSTVATVAWIGYHTPNLTNVWSLDNAEEARDSLASTVEGLQTLRAGHEPFVTLIGHSYGSTAALMALTEYDFQVDALALVGSPGSAAQSVSQLHVRDGSVFVGKAQWDPVPNSAFFGSEPGSAAYGATSFGTDGGVDPITGATMLRSFFHIEYFSPGTESLRNLALIGIGRGDDVTAQ